MKNLTAVSFLLLSHTTGNFLSDGAVIVEGLVPVLNTHPTGDVSAVINVLKFYEATEGEILTILKGDITL